MGPVAVTSLLIGNGIKNMLPGSENIDNPSNPAPQFVDLQNIYNRKVGKHERGIALLAGAGARLDVHPVENEQRPLTGLIVSRERLLS